MDVPESETLRQDVKVVIREQMRETRCGLRRVHRCSLKIGNSRQILDQTRSNGCLSQVLPRKPVWLQRLATRLLHDLLAKSGGFGIKHRIIRFFQSETDIDSVCYPRFDEQDGMMME